MKRRNFLRAGAASLAGIAFGRPSTVNSSNGVRPSNTEYEDHSPIGLQHYKYDFERYWDDAFGRALSERRDITLPGRRGEPVMLQMAKTLVVPPFSRITGHGNFGTILDFRDAIGNGIEFSADRVGFTHGVRLEDFSIRNCSGNGLHVNTKLGEEVWVDHVSALSCGESGFFFARDSSGTTPLNLGHLSAFRNGNAGIHFVRTHQRTAIRVQSMSGDNNREALMRFAEGLTGGSISIGHWKCEISEKSRGKRAVLSEAGQGSYIHLGNGFVFAGTNAPRSEHAAIENLGGGRMAWDKIGFDDFHHDFWPAGYLEDGSRSLEMTPLEVQSTSFTNLPIKVWANE